MEEDHGDGWAYREARDGITAWTSCQERMPTPEDFEPRERVLVVRWIATFGGGSTCPDGQPHKADHASLRRKEPRCWRCDAMLRGAQGRPA